MLYDIEERVEEAFVAYLQANVTGEMNAYVAFTDEAMQFPCVGVAVTSTEAVSDTAEYHLPRMMRVELGIMTEATPLLDDNGGTILSSRERNAAARSDVIKALATSLLTNLIAAAGPGVAFSMAQLGSPVVRSVEGRVFTTTIPVDVIAEPVEVA